MVNDLRHDVGMFVLVTLESQHFYVFNISTHSEGICLEKKLPPPFRQELIRRWMGICRIRV